MAIGDLSKQERRIYPRTLFNRLVRGKSQS